MVTTRRSSRLEVGGNGGGEDRDGRKKAMGRARPAVTPAKVLLYVPNLVGYARIACLLGSLWLSKTNYTWSFCLYLLAFVGDAVDGMVARKLNQSSQFGAILDMVTDRCSTAGLLFVLSGLYPDLSFVFCSLMLLDLSSHWMHVQSVALAGASSVGHKATKTLKGRFFLIRLYYGNYYFFGYCCVGTELLYILLYLLSFMPNMTVPFSSVPLSLAVYYGCLPACVCKQVVNFAQLFSACFSIAEVDVASK